MSLIQFWRIFWAWRALIVGTTFCCLLGGFIVILMVPPRWKADAHVYLNLLKPDPVTGEVIGPDARSYVATQIELISDYSVVGQAVDKLGWLSDPFLIQQYQNRSPNDTRDFRHWLSQLIIDRTKADVLAGSNILEISYTGQNPDGAKVVADALMQSYLETSLAFRRAEANKNADWYSLQAKKVKAALEIAQSAVSSFEKQYGVILSPDDKTDLDSARLAAMSMQGSVMEAMGSSSVESQLVQTDVDIKNATAALGPNHPEVQNLRAKRLALAELVAKEHNNAGEGVKTAGGSNINAQKALVISERENLAKLKNLQTEVDIQRDLYNKTEQKEVDFRQQAAVTDAGLTPLGNASVPQSPTFPNKTLIIGGCLGLGFVLGALLGLLIELLNRRVRGVEDLESAFDVPMLTVLVAAR